MEPDEHLDLEAAVRRLEQERETLRTARDTAGVEQLARQRDEFSGLLSLSQLIVSELDLARVFELVAVNAREIVQAELVVVPMLNEERNRYAYVAAAGVDADAVIGESFPTHVGMCGWVLRNERSLLFGEGSSNWIDEKTAWEAGQQSAVLVPLIGRKGILGGLSALGKRGGGSFAQHDLELLTMFANQVSIAIENARLFQQVTQEVEERTQAEAALRQSEQFIRGILDAVGEAFIVLDRDYRIITANVAYQKQFGLPGDLAIGKACYQVSHGNPRPCWERDQDCAVRHVFQTGERHSTSHKHVDADGDVVFVESKAYPMKDAAGNVVSVIETVSNVTERVMLEEERLKTQKLESIGTLAGGIAHDFNNLLQSVFGYIAMAKLSADHREEVLASLDQSENALRQAAGLTTQLLTFARGGKPVRRPIDLRAVIESSTKFALSGSQSDVRIDIAPNLSRVEADDVQIAQVIQNIVLNSHQAMPNGGSIVVTARNVADGDTSQPCGLASGNYVCIAVQDTGDGIPEQIMDKIFDPYFTTKDKGSGLGLATSYSIVRNHAGTIDARTEPGEGSTFSIYLPSIVSDTQTVISRPPTEPLPAPRAKVLAMDDDDLVRNLAARLIGALGHDVDVARHGQEALDKYRQAMEQGTPIDVVILDLTVRGGMGGVETMQKLLEFDPSVKAIVSSGYSDDGSMAEHLSLGFKAFLKKPYNLASLRETLAAVLASSSP